MKRSVPLVGPLAGLAAIVGVVVAGVLIFGRSLTIERGFALHAHRASGCVFDVWSYGQWTSDRRDRVAVNSSGPPFDLVLAIRPDHRPFDSVEILAAAISTPGGRRVEIINRLANRTDTVTLRPAAAIATPYAAFRFDDAIGSHGPFTLHLEIRTSTGGHGETSTHSLSIPPFEKRTHGFVLWDVMMGV